MRKGVAATALGVLVLVGMVAGPAATPASASEVGDFSAAIDGVRATAGLPGLQVDGGLSAVAQRWAEQMAAAGRISHNPNLAGDVTADWRTLGENVGVAGTVPSMMAAFVASPGHYANLVNGEYTHVGIGLVRTGDGKLWAVHVFMGLRGSAPAPPPPPEVAPEPAPEPEPEPEPEPAAPAPVASEPAPTDPGPAATAPAPAPPAQARRVATVLAALRHMG